MRREKKKERKKKEEKKRKKSSSQHDLVRDAGFKYFMNVFTGDSMKSDERSMAAYVLSLICHKNKEGQHNCLKSTDMAKILSHISDRDPNLRQWICLYLGELWYEYPEAKTIAIKSNAHEKLQSLLTDVCAEVSFFLSFFFFFLHF